jgi:hypothetical protein
MKTISKEGKVRRVDDETAEQKVKAGWNYAPKSLWKEQVRNPEIKSRQEAEAQRLKEKQERAEQAKQGHKQPGGAQRTTKKNYQKEKRS